MLLNSRYTKRIKYLFLLCSGLLFLSATTHVHAIDPINTTWRGNLAIEGYDAVAYFTENQAVKGSDDHEVEWMDANWRFSSAENLALFQLAPQDYAPQYGGYCAWAVSNGKTANIDPDQFTIVDNKLYLNYNAKIQEKWLADRDALIDLADQNWPELID